MSEPSEFESTLALCRNQRNNPAMQSAAHGAPKPATMADIEALPDNVIGEVIDGVLYTTPRPRPVHADVQGALIGDLRSPFQRGRGGPGGWWILIEPGIDMPGSPEVVPDLAGWRKERLPALPRDRAITVAPDWVCEIQSPSTRAYDQRIKRPFYARIGVAYLWFLDLEARTLIVSKLLDGRWLEVAVFGDRDVVRAEPFDAIDLSLAEWWLEA
jgi:Uma2 family endonuclease